MSRLTLPWCSPRAVEGVNRFSLSLSQWHAWKRKVPTFVRALASIDGFRGDSAFRTWLHTIAVSVTLRESPGAYFASES